MKAQVAVIATITMVVGLTVGFMVGKRVSNEPEGKAGSSSISTAGCEEEFRMLAHSVILDMRMGCFGESPFPNLVRDEMVAKGYTDPVKEILENLNGRPDLIPYSGVLGGIMAFRQARVLSSDRVLAMFDDGHIGGWELLGFKVKERGEIEWKLVYATVDGQEAVKPSDWRNKH